MSERMDPVVLVARAVLLASVTVFLGVAGHVTADGLLPGPVALGMLVVVAVVAAAAFLSRPATALRLVTLLVGGQALVHTVLSAGGGHVGDPVRAATAPVPHGPATLPTVDGRRVGSLQDAWASGADHAAAPRLPLSHLVPTAEHAPMMLAHALVAVLVGLWLAVGERALFTLLALAAAVVLRPLGVLGALARAGVPVVRRPAARRPVAPVPPRPLLLARCVVRRGPPLLTA
ncbi:hypothetical protein [Nocardioides dongkuii]|uniref:hypothetical protein n=1 Tax=Nocardioides dongkuii TaxID=2760089 RepID=UPI0015FB0473|nr:hypothetical protein [Nocardioides dongkuii]